MIHPLVFIPHPVLLTPAEPVTRFDDALQALIDDMFETMVHAKGVGLAAPQIGVSLQLSVIDVTSDRTQPLVLINPEIVHAEGKALYEEGCLSIPGVYAKIERAMQVTLRALDRTGNPFEMHADGLLGECFQHEIDHLKGRLFIDYLSPLKRALIRRKFEKQMRTRA